MAGLGTMGLSRRWGTQICGWLDLGHSPRGLWGWALFYADDLALELFVLRGFDLCLVLVDLVVDLAANDELGGVDGFFGIGAACCAVAFGVEGEVLGRMLVLFVFGSHWFEVL